MQIKSDSARAHQAPGVMEAASTTAAAAAKPEAKAPGVGGSLSQGVGLQSVQLPAGVAPVALQISADDQGASIGEKKPMGDSLERAAKTTASLESRRPANVPGERQLGNNPFDALRGAERSVAPLPRLLSETPAQGNKASPELNLRQLQLLLGLLGRGKQGSESTTRLLMGSMLMASDAQGGKPLGGTKQIDSFTSKLIAGKRQAALEDFKSFCRIQTGQRVNVEALVQRVLRESYLIGSGTLLDHANKVKHFNELKKQIREQLNRARDAQQKWSALSHAQGHDGLFVAADPFSMLRLDDVTAQWYSEPTTQDDIDHWQRITAEAAANSKGRKDAAGSYAAFKGPSTLHPEERRLMEDLITQKWGWDPFNSLQDDVIRENLSDLLNIVPRLNAEEFDKYIPEIFNRLSKGKVDADEIVQIIEAFSPAQSVFATATELCFAKKTSISTSVGRAIALGPFAIIPKKVNDFSQLSGKYLTRIFEKTSRDGKQIAALTGESFEGEFTPMRARELLRSLKAHHARNNPPNNQGDETQPAAGPVLGEPRAARTRDELDIYIKELEDTLNSVGEDGQLANVDLQNALQQQQQTLQMLANISKLMHDTALTIIRKQGS